ncbi:flippase [Geobacter hydrogenophilus]|uniref:O-unit flippase n=1 Tax=Geobacter hydrogenophilus TaxID=40983 RepID=A0A9W6LBY9_9BACT|nr:flippase [Geobacter hydrogenophilus]MBT0894782.1 flippase [Geobacter hydrogenophilus]GLI37380.1 O-unit flippase [Geobacter hydrogenophilus]
MNDGWIRYLPGFVRKRLEGRHVLLEAIGNTGWLFADRLLRMGVGLIVGVWIARYLGPSQYGILNYAASFVTLFSAIALLGLEAIIVRDLVRYPEREREILGTTFFLRFVAGIVSYFIAVAAIFVIRPDDRLTHLMVGIIGWVLIFGSFDTIDLWFQSQVRSKYVVYAKNAGFLIAAGLRVAFIVVKAPIIAFAVANAAEIGLGAVGLLMVYRRSGQRISRWKNSFPLARRLFTESWPLLLSGIVFMVYLRIDQVLLGQLANDREVGIYAAAVRVAELWFFIPTAIVSSVFPNIVRTKENDENEFYARLQKLYNLLAFIGYAIAIPGSLLAGLIIKLLFGAPYAAATPMLVLLLWSDIFAILAVARNAYLLAMNWSWVLWLMVLAGAVSNVLLNYMLIPHYGGVGAAVASLVSYWIAAHGACYFYKPLRRTANMLTRALIYPRFW